jgi:SagB-type dehydrogenase family enzyme
MGNAGRDFVESTKFQNLRGTEEGRDPVQPPLQAKCPADAPIVDLPEPAAAMPLAAEFLRLVEGRTSVRSYGPGELSQADLAYLLYATQGVKEVVAPSHTLRTVPSAGARHAFETYVLVNRVADLAAGLYRYLALDRKLALLDRDAGLPQAITDACLRQKFVGASAATFIWVAVVERMTWRYGQRGYRYLYLDAGHVCQNLYLAAEALGCGACAVAAFDDNALNRILKVDGETQFAIYLASVGRQPE